MEIPEYVQRVLRRLEENGYSGWCVGGCVRDTLLGKAPDDWDVTTPAAPDKLIELFGASAVPTGLKHGTVTVRADGHHVEVTTCRIDGVYRDGRRPEHVSFTANLKEDLARRDFTVNAMALSLDGTVTDPFGGQQDLQDGILRCVGDPTARLQEDSLRIMRGLRFQAVLNLTAEPATAAALHHDRQKLSRIAVERIQTELRKLLNGINAADVLRQYPDVIGVFWQELLPLIGFNQHNPHHNYDVWEHTLHALDAAPQDSLLRLTLLLHDVGKPSCFTLDESGIGHFYGHPQAGAEIAKRMLCRLKFDNFTRDTVVRLICWHDRNIPRTHRGIRRALSTLGETDLRRLIAVKRADNLAQVPAGGFSPELDKAETILNELLSRNDCFSLKQLAVNGRDLSQLGLSGRAIGRTLNALLDQVIDGALPNNRDVLLKMVKNGEAEYGQLSDTVSGGGK